MNNQREIYKALLAGETLVHVKGHSVTMDAGGSLIAPDGVGYEPHFFKVEEWEIYKEPEWCENIPDGGVLCWCKDGESDKEVVDIVVEQGSNNGYYTPNFKHWIYAAPLTKKEIQAFMDNAPENIK